MATGDGDVDDDIDSLGGDLDLPQLDDLDDDLDNDFTYEGDELPQEEVLLHIFLSFCTL